MSDTTLQRRTAVAAAVLGSAGAAATFAEPAAAVPQRCWANTICEYSGPGFGGEVQWWNPNGSDNTYGNNVYLSNPGVPLNDSISSVWNNSNRWVRLCIGAGCNNHTEPGLCLPPDGAVVDLNYVAYNNNLSSHYTYGSFPGNCWHIAQQRGCSW